MNRTGHMAPRGTRTMLAFSVAVFCAACTRPPADAPSPSASSTPPSADARTSPATPASPEAATPSPATPAPLVLPGDFTAGTDLAMLERRFGKANVRDGDVPGPEGTTARGVTLYPDDLTRRAYLYASEAPDARGFKRIRVFDEGSLWRLDGIGVGSPIADVLRANGGAFDFSGGGWDYGGYVLDWRGGKLSTTPDMPTPVVRLELTAAFVEPPRGKGPLPIGEATYRSDDPLWPDLDMTVSEIGVSFPPRDIAP